MTAPERFEHDLPQLLAQLAAGPRPDYRDSLVEATAATRQRPAWTFPGRWLPMDIALAPVRRAPVPIRAIALVALLLVALAGALLLVGASRPRLPEPFGPAKNGVIAYGSNGDLYTLAPGATSPELLLGGSTVDSDPDFSQQGDQFLFVRKDDAGGDLLMLARADGSEVRRAAGPLVGLEWAAWSPDGTQILYQHRPKGLARLSLLDVRQGTVRDLDVPDQPEGGPWRPGHPNQVLYRAHTLEGVELRLLSLDTGAVTTLAIPSDQRTNITFFGQRTNWSPDGRQLGLELGGAADGPSLVMEIADVADDGTVTAIRPFVHDRTADYEYSGTFTPDGRSLVFASQRGCVFQAWIAPIDDASKAVPVGEPVPQPPTSCATSGITPVVSPDGTRILTAKGDGVSEDRLFLGGTDGSGAAPLGLSTNGWVSWQRLAP